MSNLTLSPPLSVGRSLITGATGFIGFELAKLLNAEARPIRLMVRRPASTRCKPIQVRTQRRYRQPQRGASGCGRGLVRGGHGPEDGTVEARRTGGVGGWIDGKDLSIGALAGVWATENTRAGIWDAMSRRETFATSGPRIQVRFFGGVGLAGEPAGPQAMIEQGYELGVPMGGDLGPTGAAPTFTVYALKDPDGANLDRIQVIKGWVDADGELHEQVVDVAWAGDRQ